MGKINSTTNPDLGFQLRELELINEVHWRMSSNYRIWCTHIIYKIPWSPGGIRIWGAISGVTTTLGTQQQARK